MVAHCVHSNDVYERRGDSFPTFRSRAVVQIPGGGRSFAEGLPWRRAVRRVSCPSRGPSHCGVLPGLNRGAAENAEVDGFLFSVRPLTSLRRR